MSGAAAKRAEASLGSIRGLCRKTPRGGGVTREEQDGGERRLAGWWRGAERRGAHPQQENFAVDFNR